MPGGLIEFDIADNIPAGSDHHGCVAVDDGRAGRRKRRRRGKRERRELHDQLV